MSDLSPTYREYWQEIASCAETLVKENSGDEDAIQDALHELIDGHEFIIYTGKSIAVLMHSPNENAYFDDMGALEADSFSDVCAKLAFFAMRADVQEKLQDALEAYHTAQEEKIETLALECARMAREQGATAPWDGDMQPGDLQALARLLGGTPSQAQLECFEQAFCRALEETEES